MPNFGDVVKYTEFGRSYKALVVGLVSIPFHEGANDEPSLNLVIVKQIVPDACANCGNQRARHGKPNPSNLHVCGTFVEPDPVQTANPLDFVHAIGDVAHESHVFTKEELEALNKNGVTVSQAYPGGQIPGGRWSELDEPASVPQAPEPTGGTPAPTVQ